MKEYIYVLILTAVMAAVAELLTDGGSSAGVVRMVAGLCVLVALVQPVKEGILWLREASLGEADFEEWLTLPDEGVDAEAVFNGQLSQLGRQEVERATVSLLAEQFGVRPEDCRVEAELVGDGGEMRIECIRIVLSGMAILKNPHSIEAAVKEAFGGECVVAVE